MAISDAIVVGEDWISEHYFASDGKQSFQVRVNDRRKEWDSAAKDGAETTRSRFVAQRGELLGIFSGLGEEGGRFAVLPDLYARLRRALGYDQPALQRKQDGPVERVGATGIETVGPLAIVEAIAVKDVETLLARGDAMRPRPADRTLLEPYQVDEKTQIFSVARLLSHLFVQEDAPEFALVMAGGWALVAERARWAEGRYLAVDLQLVAERAEDKRGGETDRALTCLDAQSLAPSTEGGLWWPGVLEESVKHTVGVSQDLRDGVRLSIELIANEVVRRRAAQGLPPLPKEQAQPLAKQSLRFLYRVLFLLYAEASPELGVLPVGDPVYEQGYSLDRLRELVLVDLADQRSAGGTHLYQSLGTLFELVDGGHDGGPVDAGDAGLTFRALRADLFLPSATALINEVGLGNAELQKVLRHLLLSKEVKGKDRGFISYAELGINQLGAVYEGLMSYTGFFAENDLYEVAKEGDASRGSWVVPVERAHGIAAKDFVPEPDPDPVTGERKAVLHERGTFVYRLAGRERQQSASYYTPEVLTRFTVGQALEELLDQEVEGADAEKTKYTTSAREILDLTVCEPALGSGAFAIEAVRQLAAEYLKRRQDELGERIDPDSYPRELQKVKSYIALHNVYGVDLNATAVELAEISLWLDTMGEGLSAPWFGLHLRRGNSLIGARRAVFRRDQLAKKTWLDAIPADRPLFDAATGEPAGVNGGIHHFLLPAKGWGSAVDAKEAKELAPEALAALKVWRRQVLVTPSKKQGEALAGLAQRVELLWDFAVRRLQVAERFVRRGIDVWGAESLTDDDAVSREQVEAYLADANSAYRRLRTAMDAWCSLWFWPLTSLDAEPPTLDEWIGTLQGLLGTHLFAASSGSGKKWRGGDQTLLDSETWDELGEAEALELGLSGAVSIDRLLAEYPWLGVVRQVAGRQGFFHWELDFAAVFAGRGGFDLQVGNPPWVRPRSDVGALLAEADPWWQLKAKSTQAEDKEHREYALSFPGMTELVVDGTADVAVISAFLGTTAQYPHLLGLQPDLYRCFMEQTWRHMSPAGSAVAGGGTVGLIHPETHLTDEKAGPLRAVTYRRLRRHFQFRNELKLFEIGHTKSYGVHVYGHSSRISFDMASSLYHPDTVNASYRHDGSGTEPGKKDEGGGWDLRPHASRIYVVTEKLLQGWNRIAEDPGVPVEQTRALYPVNRSVAKVLERLAGTTPLRTFGYEHSPGWHQKNGRTSGRFDIEVGRVSSWQDVILQGPALFVSNPFFKFVEYAGQPSQGAPQYDLEHLESGALPVTEYKPVGDRVAYDTNYNWWQEEGRSAREFYRLAWRYMADNEQQRTLIPAIIPPGAAHIDGIVSIAMPRRATSDLAVLLGHFSSLLHDFMIRVAPKSTIRAATVGRLPVAFDARLSPEITLRTLRLNCVTDAYADLWSTCWSEEFVRDEWASRDHVRDSQDTFTRTDATPLGAVGPEWSVTTPLRRATDRRRALLEIDALVALSLGITADELCTIYRTQFPVLYGYDRTTYIYDANGRLVPNSVLSLWRRKGRNEGTFAREDLTATHPGSRIDYSYTLPFIALDREQDLRTAYQHFQQRTR